MEDNAMESPVSVTRVVTSTSLKMARFVSGWPDSGDELTWLESLDDAGKAQTPVSGSQTWSVIVSCCGSDEGV